MESEGRTARRIRLWSLREDVLVEVDSEHDLLVVVTRWGETRIDRPGDVVRESLRRMCLGPISLENVLASDGPKSRAAQRHREWGQLGRVLELLGGCVVHSLGLPDGAGPLLSAVPIARSATFRLPEVNHRQPVRLSRFAAMRAADGELLLESPLSQYRVELHRQLASQVVAALSAPASVTDVARVVHAEAAVVADIIAFLAATGVVLLGQWHGRPGRARFDEDTDPNLLSWSHHDLLFHSSSRMGRHGGQSGAVYPHADKLPSPPLVKQVPAGPRFPLYRPEIGDLITADPPLTDVLENARMCPELADRGLTAEQVGELLYRAARIRLVRPASAGGEVTYEISDRPYLSVYGLHELELYVSVHNCEGLSRGVYHYDPREHALTLVNDSGEDVDDLLDLARVAAGTSRRPPLLITLTTRSDRSSWMYSGISYALTLTHVGALQQTLFLVASAMGLGACVPAVDPSDLTDRALRLRWPAEVGIGEFFVGYFSDTV